MMDIKWSCKICRVDTAETIDIVKKEQILKEGFPEFYLIYELLSLHLSMHFMFMVNWVFWFYELTQW